MTDEEFNNTIQWARGQSEINILALTIFGEARGEGPTGMRMVGRVILNRAVHPGWWGRTIKDVCLMPWQFSCWNKDDPNLKQMCSRKGDDPDYLAALVIATNLLSGIDKDDPTEGADHYHAVAMVEKPYWMNDMEVTVADHGHVFYRSQRA